jgi:hypothetical protein
MYVHLKHIRAFCIYHLVSGVSTLLLLMAAVVHHKQVPPIR